MIDEELFEAEEKMEKAVTSAKDDLQTLRTGRANPNMFARIQIDYYGAPTPLTQMAQITVPEARMAVIKPYDMSQLSAIEKGIRDSDLGVNPSNDGNILRVIFPQLTEERRRELGKTACARARTPRSPSATSVGAPRTPSTSWSRTRSPRSPRTTAGPPRRNSRP